MKRLIPTIILFFAVSCFAQEKPEAFLIDEFGKTNCEEMSMRASNFVQNISKSENTIGYVVMFPDKDFPDLVNRYQKNIIYTIYANKVDPNRFEFLRGKPEGSQKIQFWSVPLNGQKPTFDATTIKDNPHDLTKPFVFGYEDEIGICPTFSPHLYAELLTQNPKARGHIVVSGPTKYARQDFARNWLETFEKNFGLPRNRFRIFLSKKKAVLSDAEFWFVPRKL